MASEVSTVVAEELLFPFLFATARQCLGTIEN